MRRTNKRKQRLKRRRRKRRRKFLKEKFKKAVQLANNFNFLILYDSKNSNHMCLVKRDNSLQRQNLETLVSGNIEVIEEYLDKYWKLKAFL